MPRDVCELAPEHVNSDRVEAAYRRTDLFKRRRRLMHEWAAYVTADRSGGLSKKRGMHRQAVRLNPLKCAKMIS